MRRGEGYLWLPTGIAVVGSTIAWHDWVTAQDPTFLALAIVMQVVAGAVIAWAAKPGRRSLILFVATCVPVIGPLAALYVDRERGRGGAELLVDFMPPTKRVSGVDVAQRLVGALPPCEALISGDTDARRATITRLSQRGASEDVAILRWARNQTESEISVEAALALADLEQRFEHRLRTARAAVEGKRSYATHAALVTVICDGVSTGIVDPPLVTKLASEARRHFLEASVLDPDAALELTIPCGRLELAARRPDLALVLAKRGLSRSTDPALLQLFTEAAYAARRFDLIPGLRSREADVRAA